MYSNGTLHLTFVRRIACLAFVAALSACATWPVNKPLQQYKPDYGYRFSRYFPSQKDDETFIILTFSGGGTRAAALAYGVLRELDRTPIGGGRSLLDEVDVISSVSGGSFASMYFALNGKEGLPAFERDFLRRDIGGILKRSIWKPQNIVRLMSPRFSRADLAAEIYDREVFHHATYGDVLARNRRPFVIINAAELDVGSRFEFTQEEFDGICSDLESFSVSRAVTASSAVPALLTPIRLRSYAGGCDFKEPEWVDAALGKYATDPLEYREAFERRAIVDESRAALHLMDGGIADNLGLRTAIKAMTGGHGDFSLVDLIRSGKIKRVAVISVNAGREPEMKLGVSERGSSIASVMTKVLDDLIRSTSFETLGLLHKVAEDVDKPLPVYVVQVALYDIADPQERAFFHSIPTAFTLSSEQVDRLIDIGPRMLRDSAAFQALVRDMRDGH
ncbi:MAG TPA: patatin-like phospholipase family protein [Thermoanaerobaculia bacterium]|nr:patatin-like phospholipase family protein [Thermoanaerobaculia bacterium]